jgi:hypothetical protein
MNLGGKGLLLGGSHFFNSFLFIVIFSTFIQIQKALLHIGGSHFFFIQKALLHIGEAFFCPIEMLRKLACIKKEGLDL